MSTQRDPYELAEKQTQSHCFMTPCECPPCIVATELLRISGDNSDVFRADNGAVMSATPGAEPAYTRSRAEIEQRIAEIRNDDRMGYKPADVQSNAYLALIQVEGESAAQALEWALGKRKTCAQSYRALPPPPSATREVRK